MKNKKQAFTLAEVLLVLAIIGTIASVTIPATMQQSSIKKFSALTRKAQTTLQTAVDVKKSLVPYGPGDLGLTIIQWLTDGANQNLDALKAAQTNSNSNTIQTPDGMIINAICGACPDLRNRRAVCQNACGVRVDLNGAEGPTRTTVNNVSPLSAASNLATAYDTVYFIVGGPGDRVIASPADQEDAKRARKYLDMQ